MRLPAPVDYQQAVCTPSVAFPDQTLRRSSTRLNPLGMPAIASGGFALTFDVTVDRQRYAIRCFHRQGNHLRERYSEISKFIRASSLEFLIEVEYLADGIRVGNNTYPIVRMPWVVGERLNTWIDDHLYEPAAIGQVRRAIASAVAGLRAHDVAHGDLQHGNILVTPNQSIRLIDYDGMYLPALRPYGAAEQGHRNYQHPRRGTSYQSSLDLFAACVIDLSLAAIIAEPQLWKEFNSGENLLFSAEDFAAPDTSAVLGRLQRIPALADQVTRLRRACEVEFSSIPMALDGTYLPPVSHAKPFAAAPALGPDTIRATDRAGLIARQGDEVTVVGKVVSTNTIRRGGDITFLNFGEHWRGEFTIVAFDRGTRDLIRTIGNVTELKGTWVAVTGLLTIYRRPGSSVRTPQIELSRARSLRQLSAAEAMRLLARPVPGGRPARGTQPTTPATSPPAPAPVPPRPAPSGPVPSSPARRSTGTPPVDTDLEQRVGQLYASPRFNARVSATRPSPARPGGGQQHPVSSSTRGPQQPPQQAALNVPPAAPPAPPLPSMGSGARPARRPRGPVPHSVRPAGRTGLGVVAIPLAALLGPVGIVTAVIALTHWPQRSDADRLCACLAVIVGVAWMLVVPTL